VARNWVVPGIEFTATRRPIPRVRTRWHVRGMRVARRPFGRRSRAVRPLGTERTRAVLEIERMRAARPAWTRSQARAGK
jgi:hypothetical protein